jgi:N-succinyldiaminopimelate aminotransferase
VLTPAELAGIAEVAVEHDLVVVTDEVYEHLTFEHRPHVPLATLPGMAGRTLTCSSAGKTFSVTGWKVGWVCGPAALVASVMTAKQFLTFTSGAPLQPAVAYALRLPSTVLDDMAEELEGKRDLLCDGLAKIGFSVHVPQGTYFATTDVRPLGYDDGVEFCRELPARAGVVAIPHQVFYDDLDEGRPLVRWAFCKRDDVLLEALGRLQAAFG